jgi:hypothetical protein
MFAVVKARKFAILAALDGRLAQWLAHLAYTE